MNPIVLFILNLQFIFRPSYWHFNNPLSKEWDIELNKLLDQYKFTNIDEHHAQLGPVTLWIANSPYSSMHTDTNLAHVNFNQPTDRRYYPKFNKVRPSKLTILRCLKRLKDDVKPIDQIRDEKLKKILG